MISSRSGWPRISSRFGALALALPLLGACSSIDAALDGMSARPTLYGQLDDADAALAAAAMQETLEKAKDGQTRTWRNAKSGNSGALTPVRTMATEGGYFCRDYCETIVVGDRQDSHTLTACRTDNGTWLWPEIEQRAVVLPSSAGARLSGPSAAAFATRAGSVFENSFGNTLTVTEVKGRAVRFHDQDGKSHESHALLYARNPNVLGNEQVIAALDALWPLEIGKSASAWVYNSTWSWQLSWRVVRRETVVVPAGTFDTWVIEHSERAMGGDYESNSETWYAPALGWNVRYRAWNVAPPSQQVDEWVLVKASPATRVAAMAR